MKKLLATLAIMLGFSLAANADTITKEFYGTEASNADNNPCKGKTTRLCAKITQQTKFENADIYVLETIEDSTGNIINRQTKHFNSIEKMMRYLYDVPENAEIVEITPDNND